MQVLNERKDYDFGGPPIVIPHAANAARVLRLCLR
jgi:hypothetical protein